MQLANKGRGRVSPNPLVGAVVVRDGQVVGEGYHAQYGGPHAEVVALERAGERARGATLYVNLEPCCHYGKTPPCTDAIIRAGIRKVVVALVDPNPLVKGQGIEALRKAGIEVELRDQLAAAQRLNRGYLKWIRTGLPYVTAKAAITLDGKVATVARESKWITSESARRRAHRLRAEHDAVLVGRGTLLADDPELTVRYVRGPNPWRVILDEDLGASQGCRAVELGRRDGKTILFASRSKVDAASSRPFQAEGIHVELVDSRENGFLDLKQVLETLGKRGVTSVLVEGGSSILTSFLREQLVDELVLFLAPKLLGSGLSLAGELGISRLDQALQFSFSRIERLGPDLCLWLVPAWAKD
ncbi:MAG: bifunctional diaminohydroxyphosphoribosylaminopyrimidine deaminase/5-amino-6-(5-phosphoribosylamino)uracil reductase RibD [candidate division KSB1 bacterium]|nr:bifunctional diaminohydroxyphosphoribosylaminopyrimidine deaminase/5-amino-6-(5-phosphoribosylamino)uracil reductase RibD [candidate division KSB1 bacterium]